MKHFITLMDYSKDEILALLNLADQLKYERKNGIEHQRLKGKKLAMVFMKNSTRTRVSFETGMYELGGHALFLSGRDTQIGRGEAIQDTARVLSRYVDGIMIRTFSHLDAENLVKYGTVPVINGLTDYCHPCQVLADLMTIREHKGALEGLKICFIGDGNNMANSIIIGGIKMGMSVSIASPKGYEPDQKLREWAGEKGGFLFTNDPFAAAKGADVIFTDVWASMGQEDQSGERRRAFEGVYQVNKDILDIADKNCMLQHCLPAHRGEEITEEVFEDHADEIFDEAENRLHAQKALMVTLMQ